MSATTVYFTQAELSQAAYGTFTVGAILATDLTNGTVGMSDSQATHFIDQGWQVAAQYTDAATGVSATVFQDAAGKRCLAIRGTELSGSDLTADGLLALGLPSNLNPQFQAIKAQIDLWMNDPAVLQGQTFTVTGHSLGGYLAAAVKETYAQVTDAYLFNAPGVGGPLGNLADALTSALGLSGTPSGNIWNIRSSEGFPLISGLGYQLGTSISIQAEAAANTFANHSIVLLTDALAIQSVYAQLAPSLSEDQLNALVDASGAATNRTLEDALDALRTIILGPSTPQTTPGDRNGFYANLYALTSDTRYTALAGTAQLTVLAGLTAADIATLASSNDAQGLATRYALHALNPFALAGADYTAFNAHGELELYDPVTGTGELTGQYLADRAAFLERKLWFSTQDKNPVDPGIVFSPDNHPFQNESTYFEDAASGYKIAQGFSPTTPFDNIHRYYFGDSGDNVFSGGGVEDHLYGGAGNDTFEGGQGNDYLEGGAGNDTYKYASGDGFDTLLDSDGQGQIKIDNVVLGGGAQYGDARVFKSANGTHRYVFLNGDAMAGGDLLVDNALIVENVSGRPLDTAGDLGLTFAAAALVARPLTGQTIDGSVSYYDASGAPVGLHPVAYRYNGQATGLTTNVLYGTGGNDRLVNNGATVYGQGGDDDIVGSAYFDDVYGGTGADVIEGQGGTDLLRGAGGNDAIYGGTMIAADSAIRDGNSQGATNQKGDWLAGGSGDDTLIGLADNDVLAGGGGTDLLIGGAGDDVLLGDGDYAPSALFSNWSLTLASDGSVQYGGVSLNTGPADMPAAVMQAAAADGAADVIYGGKGADRISGGAGSDVLFGESDNDLIVGGAGEDVIVGGAGVDILYGGAGDDLYVFNRGDGRDDVFDNQAEHNVLRFGAGITAADITLHLGSLMLDLGNGDAVHLQGFDPGHAEASSVIDRFEFEDGSALGTSELLARGFDISGTDNADTLSGTSVADRIHARAGADLVKGGKGDDVLYGEDGDDNLLGQDGNDTLLGGAGNDVLTGGDGTDLLIGGAGDDDIMGDTDWVATGFDWTVTDQPDGTRYFYPINNNAQPTVGAADVIHAGEGNDHVWGDLGNDVIFGEGGADRLYGEEGNDILIAGEAAGNPLDPSDLRSPGQYASVAFTNSGAYHSAAANDAEYDNQSWGRAV